MTLFIRAAVLLIAALTLGACNSLTSDSVRSLQILTDGKQNRIPAERVNNPRVDTLLIAAGQAEGLYVAPKGSAGRIRWYGLTEQLETYNGRISQLVGLETDVTALLGNDDPFVTGLLNIDDGTQVSRTVDFPLTYQTGLQQLATYYRGPVEYLAIDGKQQAYQRIDEQILMPQINFRATNYYWVNPATGQVRRSIQHPAPNLPAMNMLFTHHPAQGEQP